jgi:hypothetical protein
LFQSIGLNVAYASSLRARLNRRLIAVAVAQTIKLSRIEGFAGPLSCRAWGCPAAQEQYSLLLRRSFRCGSDEVN